MTPTRCAIYIRVSTAMQRMEGWSLDAQRDSLTALAAAKGWKVIGVYADEGKSARKRLRDRTEIFRLLNDVRAGLVDVILFKELDRWFRNVSDFYKVQDVLDEYGVTWYSERQPNLDMSTKEGRLAANILLSVGQNEADATSDRIKYTQKFLRAQRRWGSGARTLCFGYTLDEDHHVVIDPDTEEVARALIDTTLRTGSMLRATEEVSARYGQPLPYSRVKTFMHSTLLCGRYHDDPEFVAEPYMDPKDWEYLQALLHRPTKRNSTRTFYFTGLVRCAVCGHRLGANNSGRKEYAYYRCLHVGTPHEEDTPIVSMAENRLERELLVYVRKALDGKIAEVTRIRSKKRRQPKGNRAVIDKRLARLEDLYINDETMTRERYEQKKAEILAKLVEPQTDTTGDELESLEQLRAVLDQTFDEIYTGMTDQEKQTFWRGILKSVTLGRKGIEDIEFRTD